MTVERHPAALSEAELLDQIEVRRLRASGPGGQRRNKVETAVRIEHRPTGVTAQAAERRSAEQNRRVALARLRIALALEHRRPVEPETFVPAADWAALGQRSPTRAEAPALLAEALDVLAVVGDDVPRAAEMLGVGTARLVRVLRLEPAALAAVNARLARAGKRGYR